MGMRYDFRKVESVRSRYGMLLRNSFVDNDLKPIDVSMEPVLRNQL